VKYIRVIIYRAKNENEREREREREGGRLGREKIGLIT